MLAIATTIPGIAYVLAPDVLYVGAIHGARDGRGRSTRTTTRASSTVATIVFLVGHVLGLILLAVALWRAGSVPRWAAVCLAVSPFLEIGGRRDRHPPGGRVAYLLLMAAFGACAAAIARPGGATVRRRRRQRSGPVLTGTSGVGRATGVSVTGPSRGRCDAVGADRSALSRDNPVHGTDRPGSRDVVARAALALSRGARRDRAARPRSCCGLRRPTCSWR